MTPCGVHIDGSMTLKDKFLYLLISCSRLIVSPLFSSYSARNLVSKLSCFLLIPFLFTTYSLGVIRGFFSTSILEKASLSFWEAVTGASVSLDCDSFLKSGVLRFYLRRNEMEFRRSSKCLFEGRSTFFIIEMMSLSSSEKFIRAFRVCLLWCLETCFWRVC